MEDIAEIYVIERLEQLRVIADPLRMRILERLVRRPMTMSQLGEEFGETTAKMHYHVHELEKFGLIRLVEKRERGGFLEKYYRAVAKDFPLAADLLRTSSTSDVVSIIQGFFNRIGREVLRAITQSDTSETISLRSETLWLTEKEFHEVEQQFNAILAPFRTPRGENDEQELLVHFIAHPLASASGEQQKILPVQESAPASQAPLVRRTANRRHVFLTGEYVYSRHELEEVIARGEVLDLFVLGICRFADDIPVDLVDRAVVAVHLYGLLHASPEVFTLLTQRATSGTGP